MPDPELDADNQKPTPKRSAFEWSLSALQPRESQAGRPSFMFLAGQASRDRDVRFWRCCTLAAVLGCAALVALGTNILVEARHRANVAEAALDREKLKRAFPSKSEIEYREWASQADAEEKPDPDRSLAAILGGVGTVPELREEYVQPGERLARGLKRIFGMHTVLP